MNLFRNKYLINVINKNIRTFSTENNIEKDMPVFTMDDPYKKPMKRCIVCLNDIPLDYKNVRMLSQFISPFSGKQYDAHITGLCNNMHDKIKILIGRARDCGLMAHEIKETMYIDDPKINPKKN